MHPTSHITESSSIFEAFEKIAKQIPDKAIYKYKSSSTWIAEKYCVAANKIYSQANFLKQQNTTPDSKVAIISGTRPEWSLWDLAILGNGFITIGVYPSLPAEDIGIILYDSSATTLILENEEQVKKILYLCENEITIPEIEEKPSFKTKLKFTTLIIIEEIDSKIFDELKKYISTIVYSHNIQENYDYTPVKRSREDTASIVYTSGTTGVPKGVIQTHGNHLSNVEQAIVSGMFGNDGTLFLYLPLAHSFARLMNYLGMLTPALLAFPEVSDKKTSKVDLKKVSGDMATSAMTVLPTVPRLFEKIKDSLQAKMYSKGFQNFILRKTIEAALKIFTNNKNKIPTSNKEKILYKATTTVRNKIKTSLFGSNFRHAISGGAALPININEFFEALDITIYQGYGLTETCVATNVNLIGRNKIGSVGPCLTNVEVKISENDGEILFKGPNITSCYFNRPHATAEAWDSKGWFHTGDIGNVDINGYLWITDRKKEIIVTAGGKKIVPTKVESLIAENLYIEHAILVGDEKPYCIVLITLSELGKQLQEVSGKEVLLKKLEAHVSKVNSTLASFETIKNVVIIEEPLSIENGLLTPTMKPKRKKIIQTYIGLINKCYK